MESQFETPIIPLHFGISALNTYGPMEYFTQHLERSKKEASLYQSSVDRAENNVNTNKDIGKPVPEPKPKPAHKSHEGKTHSCYVCGKTLSSTSSYYVHMKQHSGHKPYHCPMCEVSFCRKPYLEVHMRTHTGERPFQCTVCLKRFTQKSSLNIHKRSHTGERPYSCEICDKKFAVKSYVDAHRWTHVFEKPLTCEKCRIPFNSRTQYVLHMRSHSSALVYECPCGRSFTKDSYLIRHQIKVHQPHTPRSTVDSSPVSLYSQSFVSDDSDSNKDYELNGSPEDEVSRRNIKPDKTLLNMKRAEVDMDLPLPLTSVASAIQESMSYVQGSSSHLAKL